MSVSTVGLVDFRSDKERTAAYTAATKKESKKQTKLLKEQTRAVKAAAKESQSPAPPKPEATVKTLHVSAPVPPPPNVPAGWYPDQSAGVQRYWDGIKWTEHTAPLA